MASDAGASGAPQFDVVLRGYDRKQVDEHVARLQRVLAKMRADLDMARSHPLPIVSSPAGGPPAAPGQPPMPPGARPRPTPRPRPAGPGGGEGPDVVGSFTDRMQSILQAAEEEAAEIRKKARAEEETIRAQVSDLVRQRDALLAELTRMRGQLEGMLAAPTGRITLPSHDAGAAPAPSRPTGAPAGAQAASAPHQGAQSPSPAGPAPVAQPAPQPSPQGGPKPGAGAPQPGPQQPGPRPATGARGPVNPTPRPRPNPVGPNPPGPNPPGPNPPGPKSGGSDAAAPGQPQAPRPGQQAQPAQQAGQPGHFGPKGADGSAQKPLGQPGQGQAGQGQPGQGQPGQPGRPGPGGPDAGRPGEGQRGPQPSPGAVPPKGPNQQAVPGKPPGPANPVKAPGQQASGQQASGQQPSGPKPGQGGPKPGGSGPNGPGQQNAAQKPVQKPQSPPNPGQNPQNPAQSAARGNETRPAPITGRPQPAGQGDRPATGVGGQRPAGYANASEQSGSMRPRNEPEPEPGDLFRPSADQASQPNQVDDPVTTAVPQTSASVGKGDRTTLVPTVQPPIPGKAGGDAARPVPVDSTTKVSPGRPQNGHGPDGGAAPVPAGARPDQRDAGRDSQDKPRADRGNNGPTGAERADRPASASRSG